MRYLDPIARLRSKQGPPSQIDEASCSGMHSTRRNRTRHAAVRYRRVYPRRFRAQTIGRNDRGRIPGITGRPTVIGIVAARGSRVEGSCARGYAPSS